MSNEAMKMALEALNLIDLEFVCNGAHHAKKDRHELGDDCPVTARYQLAIKALEEALAKQEQGEQDTLAYREAASLAQWLFNKHFAREEHYASGRVVWGLCDTTAGVISQIDNMVCKLVREQEQGEPVAWEPIETAPKDGSMVLICLPRQMNIVVRAWYNKIHNFWQTDYEGEGGITRPTYFHEGDLWHPIPPLYTTPQPKQEQGEPDKYLMDIECTNCGAKQSGVLTVNTTPQPVTESHKRKPLTDEMLKQMKEHCDSMEMRGAFVNGWKSAEQAHGIKENT